MKAVDPLPLKTLYHMVADGMEEGINKSGRPFTTCTIPHMQVKTIFAVKFIANNHGRRRVGKSEKLLSQFQKGGVLLDLQINQLQSLYANLQLNLCKKLSFLAEGDSPEIHDIITSNFPIVGGTL